MLTLNSPSDGNFYWMYILQKKPFAQKMFSFLCDIKNSNTLACQKMNKKSIEVVE